MSRPLPLAVALSLLGIVRSQDQQVRRYDLRDLTTAPPGLVARFEQPVLPLPVGPALSPDDRPRLAEGHVDLQPNLAPRVDVDRLVEWLQQVAGGEIQVRAERGQFVVSGSTGAHARVRSALQALQAVRQRRTRLTLHLLPPNAAAESAAVLTAAQVDALLTATPPLRSTTAAMPADEPWVWSSGRSVRCVRDYDVEVAEKSSIADPKSDHYFVGTRCSAVATPLIDGRVLVRVGLRTTAEPKGPRVRVLPGSHLGRMHLPDLAVEEARTSAVLPAGGGLLIAGNREQGSWLLRTQPGPPPGAIAGMVAMPTGALAIVPLGEAPRRNVLTRPADGEEAEVELPESISVLDAVESLLGNLDARREQLLTLGSHLVLVDEPALQARLEKTLQKEAASLDTHSIEFRVGRVGHDVAVKHVMGQLSEAELAAMLPRGGTLAALPQHAFAMTSGRETMIVRDYEVEIAAKAAVSNPITEMCESGIQLRGMLRPDAGSEMRLHVDLRYSDLLPFEPFEFGNPALGDVDLPTTAWTEFADDIPLRKGEWQIVHVGAEPALVDARSLVVAVRVR